MLSYFGCDQSQVQRYLTAKSLGQARHSLLLSGFVKIPLQVLVLMTGVFMFLFDVFHQPPMLFNSEHQAAIERSVRVEEYRRLETEFATAFEQRRTAAVALTAAGEAERAGARERFRTATGELKGIRGRAATLVREVTGAEGYKDSVGDTPRPDVNYVFPTFVTTRLPPGLVGLIIAAIFAAAMSATAGELSATATATVIDIYRRLVRPSASDAHYLVASRLATAFWGIVACVVAHVRPCSSIPHRGRESVRLVLLRLAARRLRAGALAFRRANGHGAFVGLISGIIVVAMVAFHPATKNISFLWHNPIGVVVVVIVGLNRQRLDRRVQHATPGRGLLHRAAHERCGACVCHCRSRNSPRAIGVSLRVGVGCARSVFRGGLRGRSPSLFPLHFCGTIERTCVS